MILVIDNYDSFTYNLVQYLGELGTEPLVRRNDEITVDEIAAMNPERIVISPGPGRPEQAGITLDVIRRLGPTTPLLGVCLGHQAIGMAFGGSVVRAQGADARQDVDHQPRREGAVRGHREPVHGRAVSLAHRRPRRDGPRIWRLRRRPKTTAPSWRCGTASFRFTACSSIPNRS